MTEEDTIDIELIHGVKNGDIRSFERMFSKYYSVFYKFALGLVKDEWYAEDIAQNVFMKVWQRRATLKEDESLYSYLYVLTKYEIYDHFREKHIKLVDRIGERFDFDTLQHDAEDTIYHHDLETALNDAIESLPEKRKEIFKMSRYECLSSKEIAERTGLSVRTVEKHIELALRDLRAKLSPFLFCLLLYFNL
jgi:RNA polymerase sigma-70 factor (ECF subfamily)